MENSHERYLNELLEVVCETLGVKRDNVISESRERELVDARRIFLHIAFNNNDYGFSSDELGVFVKRSRWTVEQMVAKTDDFAKHNKGFFKILESVQRNMLTVNYNHIPQL